MNQGRANHILGYPPDARLLILNADDFGMCHSMNQAIIHTLETGPVRSTSLMAPGPWAPQAYRYLSKHPETAFGIHLTAISDPDDYRWGPLVSKEQAPTLVDRGGYFHKFEAMPALLARLELGELELEFRAQIEHVLEAGLKPTHLDWHALRLQGREEMMDLLVRLAKAYGLALRVMGRATIEKLQAQGLPASDYDFIDSYLIPPEDRPARYAQLLRALPAGLSELAVHPGLDSAELRALEPGGNRERPVDYEFWTSGLAKEIVEREGIIILDYRPLQAAWQAL